MEKENLNSNVSFRMRKYDKKKKLFVVGTFWVEHRTTVVSGSNYRSVILRVLARAGAYHKCFCLSYFSSLNLS